MFSRSLFALVSLFFLCLSVIHADQVPENVPANGVERIWDPIKSDQSTSIQMNPAARGFPRSPPIKAITIDGQPFYEALIGDHYKIVSNKVTIDFKGTRQVFTMTGTDDNIVLVSPAGQLFPLDVTWPTSAPAYWITIEGERVQVFFDPLKSST